MGGSWEASSHLSMKMYFFSQIFVFQNWNHFFAFLLGDTSYALPSKLTNWQTSYHRGGAY